MAQFIKDLPDGLRQLAESRVDTTWGSYKDDGSLHRAFEWACSPEGHEFWYNVCYGDYSEYYAPKTVEDSFTHPSDTVGTVAKIPDLPLKTNEEATLEGTPGNGGNGIADVVKKDGKGLRYNEGKTRFDLMHPVATKGIADVLTKGAEKYDERNWERGMKWSSVLASMKRHINAFERGEDFDPETGLLHIDHVQCNAHFLSAFYKIYPQGDDRRRHYLDTPKIGLDIDEVLCGWLEAWMELKEIEDAPTSWYFDRDLIEDFEKMKASGEIEDFYLSLQPLIKPEEIPFEPHCYITSRPVDTHITEQWLAKHGFPARPVFTTGVGNSKVDIAKEQGVEVFVDDGFHNFKALNEAGITCFLYDAPHNRRYDVGYRSIKDLKQLV